MPQKTLKVRRIPDTYVGRYPASMSACPPELNRADTPCLTRDQTDQFHRDGYLALDALTSRQEVETLRMTLDELFQTRAGWEEGEQYDLAGTDAEGKAPALPQILDPYRLAPQLNDTCFRFNAHAVARQLLGPHTNFFYEHAILKPALYGAATPWHQDEAHRFDPGVDYEMISFWMALQDADEDNGCLSFIPGSHWGPVLEHQSPNNDPRIPALECVGGFDPNLAVACPVPRGGVVIHHCRVLHYAGPNPTAAPRSAYVLTFRGPSRPASHRKPFPWLAAKQTARYAPQNNLPNGQWTHGSGWRTVTARSIFRRIKRTALSLTGSPPSYRPIR